MISGIQPIVAFTSKIALEFSLVLAVLTAQSCQAASFSTLGHEETRHPNTSHRSQELPALPMLPSVPAGCDSSGSWWMESTKHGRGFKNVHDFGAKGDGVTDDTAAITRALTDGRSAQYSTKTPTSVYLPAGTYIVSASLPIYFYTFISGSPCAPSIVKMKDNIGFSGYIFDGDFGQGEWSDDDNQFYRALSQITIVNGIGNPAATGLHWAQSQATHLRNVTIDMSTGGKAGVFGENGSGGFIDGLTIIGSAIPLNFGNQQFAVNGLHLVGTALTTTCANLLWSWTITFSNLRVENCPIGITFLGNSAGSLVLVDATFINVTLGVKTSYSPGQAWNNSAVIYLERLTASNVDTITPGLPGGPGIVNIASWAQGPTFRNGTLTSDGQSSLPLIQRNPLHLPSRPTLADLSAISIVNVFDFGAVGDGKHDDTAAIKAAIAAQPVNGVVFFPQGAYILSDTIFLREDSTLLGEALSELRPSPSAAIWSDPLKRAPMIALPRTSQSRGPRLIEFLIATIGTGDVPGCVLLDWQSGVGTQLFDVHFRILDVVHTFAHVHGTGAGGVWSNGWQWLADHDIDTGALIGVKSPRGMLVEDAQGPLLLFGVAAEHSYLYQFNFSRAANIVIVTAQTESPYWQKPQEAWAMTIENSAGPHVLYGGGFYSWFNGPQQTIFRLLNSPHVTIYSLNTYGATMMEVGDVNIKANLTTDEDWFCSVIIAQLQI